MVRRSLEATGQAQDSSLAPGLSASAGSVRRCVAHTDVTGASPHGRPLSSTVKRPGGRPGPAVITISRSRGPAAAVTKA